MKEIHLGQILGEHRRKQKVTQEELACFLGVSKAAVSKWETETAYPDILMQIGIYKDMLSIINQLLPYIRLCTDDAEALLESCRRLKGFCSLFHLKTLHPGVFLSCLLTMAQELLIIGEKDQCLELLEEYTSLAAEEIYPLKLHGDDYFSFIDSWFEKTSSLGDYPPRDEAVIRRSIIQALTENPALKSLEKEPKFLKMVEKLKEKEQEVHRYGNNSSE